MSFNEIKTIELRKSRNPSYSYPLDASNTARTARFSKKSLWPDVGEITKMSVKFEKNAVLTPRNVREKSNTVIYYKTPPKHRHRPLNAAK